MNPFPCPFCAAIPEIAAREFIAGKPGWARVECVNILCPANPSVGTKRGDQRPYAMAAINIWNMAISNSEQAIRVLRKRG